jgi:hypothetical protein
MQSRGRRWHLTGRSGRAAPRPFPHLSLSLSAGGGAEPALEALLSRTTDPQSAYPQSASIRQLAMVGRQS